MSELRRVLVCGGRNYDDRKFMYDKLDAILAMGGIDVLIQGGTSGADEMAADWALLKSVPLLTYFPHWKLHGNAAGPIRNAKMIAHGKPTHVMAFEGGRGTADMVKKSKAANVHVFEYLAGETRHTRPNPQGAE